MYTCSPAGKTVGLPLLSVSKFLECSTKIPLPNVSIRQLVEITRSSPHKKRPQILADFCTGGDGGTRSSARKVFVKTFLRLTTLAPSGLLARNCGASLQLPPSRTIAKHRKDIRLRGVRLWRWGELNPRASMVSECIYAVYRFLKFKPPVFKNRKITGGRVSGLNRERKPRARSSLYGITPTGPSTDVWSG